MTPYEAKLALHTRVGSGACRSLLWEPPLPQHAPPQTSHGVVSGAKSAAVTSIASAKAYLEGERKPRQRSLAGALRWTARSSTAADLMCGVAACFSLLAPAGLPLHAAIRVLAVGSQAASIALRAAARGSSGAADGSVGHATVPDFGGAGSSAGGCGGAGRRRGAGGRQPVREVRAVLQRGAHRQHLRQRDRQPRAADLRARTGSLQRTAGVSWMSAYHCSCSNRGPRQACTAGSAACATHSLAERVFSCISWC